MIPQNSRSPMRNQRWVECKGSSLSFGDCCLVTDSTRSEVGAFSDGIRTIFQVTTPTKDSQPNTIIIGHMSGEQGYCTNDFPAYAKCDQTAVPGDEVGPVAGSRTLKKGQRGYLVMGDVQDGMARVRRFESGGKIYLGRLAEQLCAECSDEPNSVLVDVVSGCGDELPQQITAINWPNTAGYSGARCEFFKCGDLYYLINVSAVPRSVAVEDADCGGSGKFIKDEGCDIKGHTIPGVPINTCEQPSWKTQIQFTRVQVLDDVYDDSSQNSCDLVLRKSYSTFCALNPQTGGTGNITIEMDTVPIVETITLEQEQGGCDLILKGTASQICVRKFANAAPAEFGRVAFQEVDATAFTTYELDGCAITILQEFVNFCALPSPLNPQGDDEQTIEFESVNAITDVEMILTDQDGSGSGSGSDCSPEFKLNFRTTPAMACPGVTQGPVQNASIVPILQETFVVEIDLGNGCFSYTTGVRYVLGACGDDATTNAECEEYQCPDGSGSGSGQ